MIACACDFNLGKEKELLWEAAKRRPKKKNLLIK